MYHFPFEFEFVPLIQKFALKHITADAQTKTLFKKDLGEIIEPVNKELTFYKLPGLFSLHVFKRPAYTVQDIHKDVYVFDTKTQIFKKTAYNIPVYGCVDSYMEWVDGKYIETFKILKLSQNRTTYVYFPKWIDGPHIVERLKFEKSYFFNVEGYHRAIAGPEERVVASLRFGGDLTIQDYYRLLR